MFDDVKQEPEDMFEATDKVAPQVASPTDQPSGQPVAPVPPPSTPEAAPPVAPAPPSVATGGLEGRIAAASRQGGGFPWKIVLLILGILVVIGAAFLLSMRILGSRTPVTPQPPETAMEAEEEVMMEAEEEVMEEPEEVEEEVEEEPISRTDTDKDGLTDAEEAEYGTSPRAADTDSDGLFDREEIFTWETDPLNPDTDGDGYLDGEEVDGGYNPNGPGELREIPSESR